MLYIDVAKVDRDVAHVVMSIHVYFKSMFQMEGFIVGSYYYYYYYFQLSSSEFFFVVFLKF